MTSAAQRTNGRISHANADPLWYKDAIIYEVHVRAFYDSDGDGIGDFPGLTQKLDYLQDLGVTAIWLLPFYKSPLRDDGYDIADYEEVHPSYGSMQDFRTFLREAERRNLRVITELVINHTSDQHRWFQRARQEPPGSRYRDYYVWTNDPSKYQDARIIFKDFERSNWTYDPVADAYYWHRFYHHQPDLNFDSPSVRRAVFRIMDNYFRMGVSGLRLDAVPYLFEREGTNCENLPETHAFLKELRRHVDEHFPNRMLLAEANQWPEDAAAYFGNGDECHMNFNFPVMPRLFMSIQMEDRFPIVDTMQQTPAIPENCQWAVFLRNHDELTLEMVTDEERDYMYRLYARDQQGRINLGIRRRLAPLLNNDRKKIELMNSLLFSLPGTPVIYYGDEIGMGDNYYLQDRNGVRTPMQWSPDRNAGFSTVNPQRLYLPVIIDPEYHYEAINVEAQQRNSDSLLWWMKRLISIRKRYKALARGSIEFLQPENRKALAFIRRSQDETILVVANMSKMVQHVSLDLRQFMGYVPVETYGQTEFPVITEAPYFMTLGPYDCYWFVLDSAAAQRREELLHPQAGAVPTLYVRGDWRELFGRQSRLSLSGTLIGYLRRSRWFGGKARNIHSLDISDVILCNHVAQGDAPTYITMAQVNYTDAESETYQIPITCASGQRAEDIARDYAHAVIARLEPIEGEESPSILYDALMSQKFEISLLDAIAHHRHWRGEHGELVAVPSTAFRSVAGSDWSALPSTPMRAEQSNTSINYGDRLMLKLFRRQEEGVNPDLEIGRFLTERAHFPHVPPVAGALEYRQGRGHEPATVGILQGYVPNQGDAWHYTLDALARYFDNVLSSPDAVCPAVPDTVPLLALADQEAPQVLREFAAGYLDSARMLGQRTAEMHLALATDEKDPAFAPEGFTDHYRRSVYQSMRNLTGRNLMLLRKQIPFLFLEGRLLAQQVVDREEELLRRFRRILDLRVRARRIRVHGDYHLGQVLYTGNNFVIIDFEGEPARSLTERRIKRSPLRDVAGMIRSFHYAVNAALLGQAPMVLRMEDLPKLQPWADLWYEWTSAEFIKSYLSAARQSPFLPTDRNELDALLSIYLLEKAVYEVGYELNNRPAWTQVPLQGILRLLAAEALETPSAAAAPR